MLAGGHRSSRARAALSKHGRRSWRPRSVGPRGSHENQHSSDKNVLNDPAFAQSPDPDGYRDIMKLENAEHREMWFKALVEEWESLLGFGAMEVGGPKLGIFGTTRGE